MQFLSYFLNKPLSTFSVLIFSVSSTLSPASLSVWAETLQVEAESVVWVKTYKINKNAAFQFTYFFFLFWCVLQLLLQNPYCCMQYAYNWAILLHHEYMLINESQKYLAFIWICQSIICHCSFCHLWMNYYLPVLPWRFVTLCRGLWVRIEKHAGFHIAKCNQMQ